MIRAQVAVFVLVLCGSLSLSNTTQVSGQEPVAARIDSAAVYLNQTHVNQWVSLNANKSIEGKLFAIGEAGELLPRSAVEVSLVQKGKTISRVIADSDGVFQFKGIAAGSYNFVAQSDYSFATFGIHVLPVGSGSPSSFEAYVSTLSSTKAKELIKENWVPAESYGPKFFDKDPLAGKRVVNSSQRVLLQNGDLVGQVSRMGIPISEQDLTGNVAHIFQSGQSVAAAPIGRDGKFRIVRLEAGVYDLAVVGEDGNAFIGFEAVEAKPIASKQTSGAVHLVSLQNTINTLSIELADPTEMDQAPEEVPMPIVQEVGMFDQPFIGGGFPTRGGFGGGFGGGAGGGAGGGGIAGGGGFGGLLGIAGLAVGVAAISQEDDFNPIPASLISP